MTIIFESFGIKNGLPSDIDTFLDARILPNPFWETNLKDLTGEDQEAIDFMMNSPITEQTLESIVSYLDNLFNIIKDKRKEYRVGIGCTGGQHRSVLVANYLKDYYSKKFNTESYHRDMPKVKK